MGQISERVTSSELEPVGLSGVEAALYEAIVDRGSATATELRATFPGSPSRLTRIMGDLEAKGLVSRVPGRPARYAAVPPEVGLELLFVQREEELRKARRAALDLAERFQEARAGRDASGLIEIVSGQRVVAERYSATHRTAREQLRVMSRPPFVQTPEENRAITAEAHEKDVRVRCIIASGYFEFERETGGLTAVRDDIARGEQYRAMVNVPLKLIIADDRAALIPLEIRPKGIQSAVLFHASALLEALIEVFETCWALAYPLDNLGVSGDERALSAAPVSADERELLALLAAGIADGTIARQLGLSHTTVQRRIHALKARLGATTRFQAGLQAALRGWIADSARPPSSST